MGFRPFVVVFRTAACLRFASLQVLAQCRLEPLNKRLAGGCHLTRRIAELIGQAGFVIEQLDTYYFKGEPKPFAYTFEGRAVKA